MESATYSSSVISLDDDGNRKIAIQLAPWFQKARVPPDSDESFLNPGLIGCIVCHQIPPKNER